MSLLSSMNRRTSMLLATVLPIAVAFGYVVLKSGPLAPVSVVTAVVQNEPITPSLFGIGIVEARFSYKVGPVVAGRISTINVDVGDHVRAGDILAEMDPVDFNDRIAALEAATQRAEASAIAAESQVADALARYTYSRSQVKRYEELWRSRSVSEVAVETRRQDSLVASSTLSAAKANLVAARHEIQRNRADWDGLIKQRDNLMLKAPVDGVVTARLAESGTTIVAGQAIIEMIDPTTLWTNARFDQITAGELREGLPAQIELRSHKGKSISGHVARVEIIADAVTEERLAKVVFDMPVDALPSIGELAEVTIDLPTLPAIPVIPNAAVQQQDGRSGVWKVSEGKVRFTPIETGKATLNGSLQVAKGIQVGDEIVVYSTSRLTGLSRIHVTEIGNLLK